MILITNFIFMLRPICKRFRSQVEAIKPDFPHYRLYSDHHESRFLAFKVLYLRFVKSLLNLCRLPKPITLPHIYCWACDQGGDSWQDHVCWNTWWILCSILRGGTSSYLPYFTSSQNRFGSIMRLGFLRCSLVGLVEVLKS